MLTIYSSLSPDSIPGVRGVPRCTLPPSGGSYWRNICKQEAFQSNITVKMNFSDLSMKAEQNDSLMVRPGVAGKDAQDDNDDGNNYDDDNDDYVLRPGVAGQDAQDQVEAEGDAQDDDGAVVDGVLIEEEDDHGGQLEGAVDQVDQDHTLLSLSVGVFLVGGLQPGVIQAS